MAVVLLVAGLLLADRPAVAQAEPTAPYRVGVSRSADLWSTDARGGDPVAVTRGGPPADRDIAYSPDGARVAWTEDPGGEGPTRVRVADADGGGARYLSDRTGEAEPSWSPDGTRLAVRRDDTVEVVRVADGVLLSSVPRPDHLRGRDGAPAWSPDGRTIAFSRDSDGLDVPLVAPRSVGASTPPGGSFTTSATLRTPPVPRRPEIMFLLDTTGSMSAALATFKAEIPKVMDEIVSRDAGARFGVASYKDTVDGPRRYELVQNLTTATALAAVLRNNDLLTAEGGGRTAAEDWFNGLHRIARDELAGRHVVFDTPGASRIVVLAGDATSKEYGDKCDPAEPTPKPPDPEHCVPPYYSAQDVKNDLTGTYPPSNEPRGIKVVAVPIKGRGDGLNSRRQAEDVVNHTGGTLVAAGATPTEIAAAIGRGIKDLPVTVTPTASCSGGASVSFDPPSRTVAGDTEVAFQEAVRLGPGPRVPGDVTTCAVRFLFDGVEPTRPHVQTIRVTESGSGTPTVVVHGAAVPSPRGVPVPVDFSASATSATGTPLTPTCDARPGALFPVGVTSVTCTAEDRGRTGRAASTVAVFRPDEPPHRGIWLAGTSEPVVQTDLSPGFPPECAGSADSPDWSPDGTRLVFAPDGALCTANADGTGATVLVPGGNRAEAPAWSPDGALIAFDRAVGTTRRVFSVAAGGGTPRPLVSFGDEPVRGPAFRRLPDLVVAGSAVPARIAFQGVTTARFTVVNTGLAADPAAVLALAVPDGLRVERITTTVGTCDVATARCVLGRFAARATAEIRLTVTGTAAGTRVVRADAGVDVNPADNRVEVPIQVAEEVKPPPRPGSLSMAVTALPAESYVGGDDVTVVFKLRNGAGTPMTAVRVVTSLPPRLLPATAVSPGCAADGTVCDIGVLQPLQEAEVRISLPAKAAVEADVGGSAVGVGPDTDAADNTASTRIAVRQPRLVVDPLVGPTGFVPRVTGSGFPPGGTVRLVWAVGISTSPDTVPVRADGTVDAQFPVFENDQVGPRELIAEPVTGPPFAAVRSNAFLVVPKTLQPPDFAARG
ncbi:hypothetical protein KZQ38_28370 [Saccharothrix sp. SC076]|nr:hypothetical protein [Saccharothrix obliqua]